MSAVSQLIDVKYTDLTNYVDEPGGDVLGLPLFYHWGPVDRLQVFNKTQFFQAYPDGAPVAKLNSLGIDIKDYNSYAQIKRAFELGIQQVEVIRPQGQWKYAKCTLQGGTPSATEGPTHYWEEPSWVSDSSSGSGTVNVFGKYPGVPSKYGFNNYDTVTVEISVDPSVDGLNCKIQVLGALFEEKNSGFTEKYIEIDTGGTAPLVKKYYVDYTNPIEVFQGSTDKNYTVDGQSYFIDEVAKSSDYITVKTFTNASTQKVLWCPLFDADIQNSGAAINATLQRTALKNAIDSFNDTLISSSTLLINPIHFDTTAGEGSGVVYEECRSLLTATAKERQDLNAVLGCGKVTAFSKLYIKEDYQKINKDKFTFYVAAREQYNLWGNTIILDGTGGWCGATANIAKLIRTNQLASAFTYGAYQGVLDKTLTFDDVCELHELGIISIFSSNNGPMIWGVRSIYNIQTSYFAKANVMRVLAEILRQVFPIALDAIHTDAASNPITRANFNVRFGNVIDYEISQQNISSDSFATCLGEINSDVNTKGGKIFNLLLSLHFFGLVEKVKIAVYATDSSVTASIV